MTDDVPLRDHIDSQIADLRRAIERAALVPAEASVPLRQYFEALMHEQQRGVELAEVERGEKAKALRTEMERTIAEGDKALREHVKAQVHQIREALESAERLEVQRFDSLKREMQLITEAAQEAINKLADAYEKRFESVNEWRGQSADRERSQQEEMAKLSSQFMLREVADAQIADLRREVGELKGKVDRIA